MAAVAGGIPQERVTEEGGSGVLVKSTAPALCITSKKSSTASGTRDLLLRQLHDEELSRSAQEEADAAEALQNIQDERQILLAAHAMGQVGRSCGDGGSCAMCLTPSSGGRSISRRRGSRSVLKRTENEPKKLDMVFSEKCHRKWVADEDAHDQHNYFNAHEPEKLEMVLREKKSQEVEYGFLFRL